MELLDGFDAGKIGVDRFDFLFDEILNFWRAAQTRIVREGNVVILRELLDVLMIDHHKTRQVWPLVADHHSVRDIGRELQQQEKEYRNQQLVEMRLAYFKEITENHPELIVDDVKARVDLLTNSIKANPENKNTLKQVHEFKIQFEEIIEKSKEEQSKFQFVKEAMIQAVGGTEKKGPDGGSSISGNINGATITVHISPDSNNVDFDTPEDGSCGNMMHTLTDRLVNQGIKLGPIKMRKTGRVLETAKSVYTPRRRIKQ